MRKQRIASGVSATLKRAGFSPIPSGTSRFTEGVRVIADQFGATVEASHLDGDIAAYTIQNASGVLEAAGYRVRPCGSRLLMVNR